MKIEPKKPEQKEPEKELSKDEKNYALFQARLVLSKLGTMPERMLCTKQLKIMTKKLKK